MTDLTSRNTTGKNSHLLSKYQIFNSFFRQWDQVVFIDSDIIIKGDINPLVLVNSFSVCREFTAVSQINMFKLGYPTFNTGVMAFNTASIDKDFFDYLLDVDQSYWQQAKWGDQSILNLVIGKKWSQLPDGYNFASNIFFNDKIVRFPQSVIFHAIPGKKFSDKTHPYHHVWEFYFHRSNEIDFSIQRESHKTTQEMIDGICFFNLSGDKRIEKDGIVYGGIKIKKNDSLIKVFGQHVWKYIFNHPINDQSFHHRNPDILNPDDIIWYPYSRSKTV